MQLLRRNVTSAAFALASFACVLPLASVRSADSGAAEHREAEQRLRWWTDARFGMFIHWGLYAIPAGEWHHQSVPGLGEWIMNHARIPVAEYERLASQFNPVKFNAEEWVTVAKNAGAKYITITAKHHDGFAMFGSRVSSYNIVDATPFHRDPMKELASACRRAGLKLCFYYSQTQDWHEPDAVGNDWDFPDNNKKDFHRYFEAKVIPQVTELLTNYGPIGLIWFDTPRNITVEESQQLANLVHRLQPDCLVSGRVGHNLGDYVSVGDNQIAVAGITRPWETPVTINDTWGFKKDDHNWKSPQVLIRQLATTAGRGGNYLLNVGPTAEGVIPPESVERMAEIGRWMKVNGEAIYATSGSPFPYSLPWGTITTRNGRIYLHVFDWPRKELIIYGLQSKVDRARLLAGGQTLKIRQSADRTTDLDALTIEMPDAAPDAADSVIELNINGGLRADPMLQQQPDRTVTLPAYLGEISKAEGSDAKPDSRGVMEHWTAAGTSIHWNFRAHRPGTYEIELITSEQKYGKGWDGGQHVKIQVGPQTLNGTVADSGREGKLPSPYWQYVISRMGRVRIDRPGTYSATVQADAIPAGQKFGLTLVSLKMIPVRQGE